jgi:hypothetical protein
VVADIEHGLVACRPSCGHRQGLNWRYAPVTCITGMAFHPTAEDRGLSRLILVRKYFSQAKISLL